MKTSLAALLTLSVAAIASLDEAGFAAMAARPQPSLAIVFEPWCGFCRNALTELRRMEQLPEFAALGVPLYSLDSHGRTAFKAAWGVTKVPVISLFVGGVENVFTGAHTAEEILRFAITYSQPRSARVLATQAEFLRARAETGELLLHFGPAEGPRYQLFLEGLYAEGAPPLFTSDCPYLQEALGLTRGEFYFFPADSAAPLRYKRAFKRDRYLEWLHLLTQPKVSAVGPGFYEQFLPRKNPLLLLMLPPGGDDAAEAQFRAVFPLFFEAFEAAVCPLDQPDCEAFLAHFPLDPRPLAAQLGPFVLIAAFSARAPQPLLYLRRQPFSPADLQTFLAAFAQRKLAFEAFSEKTEPQTGPVWHVTRDSFKDFIAHARGRDALLLFHASRHCPHCPALLAAFKTESRQLLGETALSEALVAGHFDTSLNSHEVLGVTAPLPFLRLYRRASPRAHHDLPLATVSPAELPAQLRRFLGDAASQRLELSALSDEV